MYQALYRKYRPRRFSDVVGQEHITETLRRQVISGRLSHAYLFIGTRGTGKTTCAKILSRAANCLSPEDGDPCNKCIACIGIEDGSILDVLEIDAASNNKVDDVRALQDEVIFSPASVKKRVYIIDEVHMLSLQAFNALLKTLEEPPKHILFILASTELHKVPATIQSRCQKFSFKRLTPATLIARLSMIASAEGLTLTDEAADKLATLADGSMRDGESLLDQCASSEFIDLARVQNTLGLSGHQELQQLVKSIVDRDMMATLSKLDELYDDGKDMVSLLGDMSIIFRDLLINKLAPGSSLLDSGFEATVLSELSRRTTPENLFFCLDVLKTSLAGLSRSGGSKLTVELCLIRMCNDRLSDDTTALLSRLSNLENGCVTPKPETGEVTENIDMTVSVNSVVPADIETSVEDDEIATVLPEVTPESTVDPAPIEDPEEATEEAPKEDTEETPEESVDTGIASQESGCFWTDTLKNLESDPSVHALLNDRTIVQAEQNDNILTIFITDAFIAGSIENESTTTLIKEAAKKVLGFDIILRIEVGSIDANESKHSKLESLSTFGIFNFE